jgi:hypothetical protein
MRPDQPVFGLHRQLTALGIRNYVVCPTCLDERRHGVANDRTDALELATRLDRYLAGNDGALAVVRVPTEAEEQKRAHKRQRQQLRGAAAVRVSETAGTEGIFGTEDFVFAHFSR